MSTKSKLPGRSEIEQFLRSCYPKRSVFCDDDYTRLVGESVSDDSECLFYFDDSGFVSVTHWRDFPMAQTFILEFDPSSASFFEDLKAEIDRKVDDAEWFSLVPVIPTIKHKSMGRLVEEIRSAVGLQESQSGRPAASCGPLHSRSGQQESVKGGWDAVPGSHRIHCWLQASAQMVIQNGVDVQQVLFQADDGSGQWETVLLPEDDLGPAHVIYWPDRVEIHRYQSEGDIPKMVRSFSYNEPNLLNSVLEAATGSLHPNMAS